jgi:hypothetical protein
MHYEVAELKTLPCEIIYISSTYSNGHYILIVKTSEVLLPITVPYNYNVNIKNGDKGLLTYEKAIAGKTHWWNKEENSYYPHAYTAFYFKHFLHTIDTNHTEDTLTIS